MKKTWLLNLILLAAIVFNLTRSYRLFEFNKLTQPFNFKRYEERYNKSQWVIPNSKQSVGDDVVYAYAGAKYVKGESPILTNSEHPPFAKNLIGLSAIYLGNEYYYGILTGIFALVGLFLLAKTHLKNNLTALLLTLAVGLEPLFVANYFATLLDLIVFGLLNWYFYFLMKYNENKNAGFIYLSNGALGFIISSKFFGIAAPIVLTTLIYFVINRDIRGLVNYLLSLSISLAILVANYFQFFLHGKNIVDFLKLQKYIYVFHTAGRQASTGFNWSYFSLIFSGKFFVDKKNIAFENHYSILWPVSFVLTIANMRKHLLTPLTIWIIIYSLTQVFSLTNSRYLILILPYFYLAAVDIIKVSKKTL